MDLKATLADQLGHFTVQDIATALVSLLAAALFGFLFALMVRPPYGRSPRETSLLAAVVAFAVALVRASVPLSICLVGLVLMVRTPDGDGGRGHLHRLMAVAIGLGCGSSAALVVAALIVPMGLLFRWARSGQGS
jgi:ABC-type amino acid transport system permease subunit